MTRIGVPGGPAPKPGPRAPRERSKYRKPRRNDGPWREMCLVLRGRYCRVCGPMIVGYRSPGPHQSYRLEIDHMMPRGQGGPSVVENGLVLCPMHHQAKTESRLLIRPEWLDPDQVAWLADVGWVRWNDAGEPEGRGMKHFAAMAVARGRVE